MKKNEKLTRRKFLQTSSALAISLSGIPQSIQSSQHADLVIVGGPVLTVDTNNTVQNALAIQGNRILAVGKSYRDIQPYIGKGTKVVRLNRQCVTPGIIDVHNHVVAQASNTINWVNLIRCSNAAQVRQTLAKWILDHDWKPGTWVRSTGYMWLWDKIAQSSGEPPLLGWNDLDQKVKLGSHTVDLSRYPIYMVQLSGHYATANKMALQKAKIMDESGRFYTGHNDNCLTVPGKKIGEAFSPTSHAFGSFFQVDTSGRQNYLNGMIFHHYAMEEFLFRAVHFANFPRLDGTEITQALKQRCNEFIKLGVTSIYDNNFRAVSLFDKVLDFPNHAEPHEKVRLTLYPYICHLNKGAFPAYDNGRRKGILSTAPLSEGDWMRVLGYKLQLDAAAMTGFTWEPSNSLGDQTHGKLNLWSYDNYLEIVKALDKINAQISIHVVGDKSLDWTLDAYEHAGVGGSDKRHRIEHLPCVPNKSRNSLTNKIQPLFQRAKDMGLTFCPQPAFILYYAMFWEQAFGSGVGKLKMDKIFPRVTHSIPYRSAVEAGIPVALSSDSPCVPNASPIVALWESVHRRTKQLENEENVFIESFVYNHPDKNGTVADERVDFNQALRGHTIDAAACGFEEKQKGSLEAGKLADVVIWNSDLRNINQMRPLGAFKNLKPAMTIIDGKVVYKDPVEDIHVEKA
jgi:predicted amidohydrolase YtcJ